MIRYKTLKRVESVEDLDLVLDIRYSFVNHITDPVSVCYKVLELIIKNTKNFYNIIITFFIAFVPLNFAI